MDSLTAHYISGTHWDREWYRPFEEFRFMLVQLLDGLIELMERDPEFRHFHLDGQTCMLEDYCAIRPEQRARLAQLIRDGRILIGPWYTMPDLFCVGDEALIRNLALGRSIAQAWGTQPMPVGFICDMFGHPSQMPLIFAGFHCHDVVLGRGVNEHDTPAFFDWRGADGTTVLAFKLQDAQGYGPMAVPRACLERPTFVLAGLPAFTAELAAAAGDDTRCAAIRQRWADQTLSSYIEHECKRLNRPSLGLFDSMDHSMPAADVGDWLQRIRRLAPQVNVQHSTLPAFFAEARTSSSPLPVRSGELRAPSKDRNGYNWLIPNCVSARVRLKQANDACQALLERWVEPLLAMTYVASVQPTVAPQFLTHAWQTLLDNQAHDSIGGCSIDQVHRDMTARFDQVKILGGTLRNQAVGTLTDGVGELGKQPGEFTLILVNPLPWTRDDVCEFDLDLPLDHGAEYRESFFSPAIKGFLLEEADGTPIPYQRLSYVPRTNERSRNPRFSFQSDGEFPRYRLAARLTLPACGYRAIRVRPAPSPDSAFGCIPVRHRGSLRSGPCAADNGILALTINADGTVTLLDHRSGETYRDLLLFEHRGEVGDGWFHVAPTNDAITWSRGAACTIAALHDGPEQCTFRVEVRLPVAKRHDRTSDHASHERCTLSLTSLITLRAGSDHLDIHTILDNHAEDFRLRLLLPVDVPTATTWLAHHPFDVVERAIAVDPTTDSWQEAELAEKPFLHLQAVGSGQRGLAFISGGGLHEGGVADDQRRTMQVTLLRSFRATIATGGEPDGLETGVLTWRYALMPYAGTLPSTRAFAVLAALHTGLTTRQSGARPSGYLPLPVTGNSTASHLEQLDRTLIISAIAPAADGSGLIIRLWNPSHDRATDSVRFARGIAGATLVNLAEDQADLTAELIVSNNTVIVTVRGRSVATVKVCFAPC